jgi:hypothetical protein
MRPVDLFECCAVADKIEVDSGFMHTRARYCLACIQLPCYSQAVQDPLW